MIFIAKKNRVSQQIGALMAGQKEEAEAVKAEVAQFQAPYRLEPLRKKSIRTRCLRIMMKIPNIIDPSIVQSKGWYLQRGERKFGEHCCSWFRDSLSLQISWKFVRIDLTSKAGKVANGFCLSDGNLFVFTQPWQHMRDFRTWSERALHTVSAIHDPFKCHARHLSFEGDGCHDVQDWGEDHLPYRLSKHSMISKFIIPIISIESTSLCTLTTRGPAACCGEKGCTRHWGREVFTVSISLRSRRWLLSYKPRDSKEWYEKMWKLHSRAFRSLVYLSVLLSAVQDSWIG